jgi:hypothetical protein
MIYFINYMLPSCGISAIAASIDKDTDKMKFAAFAWLDFNQQLHTETICCSVEGKRTESKHLLQLPKASLEQFDKVLIEVVQQKAIKTYFLVGSGTIDVTARSMWPT